MATYLVRDIAQRKESLEKIAREAILVEEVGGRGGLQQGPGGERSRGLLLVYSGETARLPPGDIWSHLIIRPLL